MKKINPIWKKDKSVLTEDDAILDFLAGEDILLDKELFLFDIQASIAHVNGLASINVLTIQEAKSITDCLSNLLEEYKLGRFVLDARFEDGHSAIENYVTEKLGILGGKLHTGRSRNDQVSVATRLFMLHQLNLLKSIVGEIAQACLVKAQENEFIVLPGYTHLQRAMPSTVGLWMAGMAEAFVDNLELIRSTYQWMNKNPLGTASGFGINLPLNRESVSYELGFTDIQINPQNVQNSRGKYELQAINALSVCTLDLRRLAWDLSLYSSSEFNFVKMPSQYITGSSIMPNKNNPDVVELLRAVHPTIEACSIEIQGLLSLPSSYHRDLQNTKPALIRAFKKGMAALALLPSLINELQFNKQVMKQAIDPEMLSTDIAIDATKQGINFREAYQGALKQETELDGYSVEKSIKQRISLGGTGNLGLDLIKQRLEKILSN